MNYKSLKTETQFQKKLLADLVSRFGDSLDAIAYSWMVYALTESASLTAITFAVNTLVSVILSPFAAALITNWNKKMIIVLGDIGRGVLVLLTAFLFFSGYLEVWMVLLITALNSTLEAFRLPAGTAIFPQIVSKEKYSLAVSISGALSKVAELVGMGLAGVIVGLLGVSGALLIDAGTFLFSAFVLLTLKLPRHVKKAVENVFKEFKDNTREGFSYVIKNKLILAICLTACFLNFALTPLTALQAAYVGESLQLNASALSVMGVAMTLGMGIGSAFVPKFLEKMTSFKLFFIGALIVSLGFTALFFVPNFSLMWKWIALVFMFMGMGFGSAFANTVVQIAFMEKVEPDYLARVSGIMSSMCMLAMPVASFIAAGLSSFMDVSYVFLVFGIFAIIGTIASLFIKTLRKF